MVGHKQVVTFAQADPYSALLAQAKHEYYSRLSNNNQLVAKHGKHVLNQFLQAAFVGSRVTRDHAWLIAGLVPALDLPSSGRVQPSAALISNLSAVNTDVTLGLSKDIPLTSSLLFRDFLSAKLSVATWLFVGGRLDKTTTAVATPTSLSLNPRTALGPALCINGYTQTTHANIFERNYGKLGGGVNPFRAHNTAVLVGNRLNRVYASLSSSTSLPQEFSRLTRQSQFIRSLYSNTSMLRGGDYTLLKTPQSKNVFTSSLNPLTIENIGANLWLTRAYKVSSKDVNWPWALALLQQGSSQAQGVSGDQLTSQAGFRSMGSLTSTTKDKVPAPLLNFCQTYKNLDFYWLGTEDVLTRFTSKRGNLDGAKLSQHFFYSGDDLTVSGAESQTLQGSDVAWLAPNASTELSNLFKITTYGSNTATLRRKFGSLNTPSIDDNCNLVQGTYGLDLAQTMLGGLGASYPHTQGMVGRLVWHTNALKLGKLTSPVIGGFVFPLKTTQPVVQSLLSSDTTPLTTY